MEKTRYLLNSINCVKLPINTFFSGLEIFWKNDHFSTSFAERSFTEKRWLMVVEHYTKNVPLWVPLWKISNKWEKCRRTKRTIFLPTFFLLFRHKLKKSYICTQSTIKSHKNNKNQKVGYFGRISGLMM